MARNITITLDEDTLRAAKVAAARRGLSLSALLRAEIGRIAEMDERYEAARRAAFEWMERGCSLGGTRPSARDELHDRDALR
jgi:hypothetical protein